MKKFRWQLRGEYEDIIPYFKHCKEMRLKELENGFDNLSEKDKKLIESMKHMISEDLWKKLRRVGPNSAAKEWVANKFGIAPGYFEDVVYRKGKEPDDE